MGISLQITNTKILNEGYLLTAALSDLEHGIAPLGPPVPMQPPLMGGGVAPPGRHPWPRARGSSSRLPPLTSDNDHYIYYCGQESLRRNGVAIIVNKRVRNAVFGCNLKMLNITHYQRNANQNHYEVPFHTSQNGCNPKVYK